MNLVKDNNFDEDEVAKFIGKFLDDPAAEWTPLIKPIVSECQKKVNVKLADIVKKMEAAPFDVKKDQCNVKYGAILSCMVFDTFEVNLANIFLTKT